MHAHDFIGNQIRVVLGAIAAKKVAFLTVRMQALCVGRFLGSKIYAIACCPECMFIGIINANFAHTAFSTKVGHSNIKCGLCLQILVNLIFVIYV